MSITPKLELAICKTIREQIESSLRCRYHANNVDVEPYLQGGGEMRIWQAVQKVIEEAGWAVQRRDVPCERKHLHD